MSSDNKPKYADLINEAILSLKERTGSSLQAIKKYIASKYPAFDCQPVSYYLYYYYLYLYYLYLLILILIIIIIATS